jgi:hypothetical protein
METSPIVEAAKEAASRSRWVFTVLMVTTALLFFALWNSVTFSWTDARIRLYHSAVHWLELPADKRHADTPMLKRTKQMVEDELAERRGSREKEEAELKIEFEKKSSNIDSFKSTGSFISMFRYSVCPLTSMT